jgi:hypothetical protein
MHPMRKETLKAVMIQLTAFCLNGLGALALFAAVVFCNVTVTTNDYRPLVSAGLGSWLLGVACLGISCWRGWLPRIVFIVLCVPATLLVWADMVRRGHLVVEYLWP